MEEILPTRPWRCSRTPGRTGWPVDEGEGVGLEIRQDAVSSSHSTIAGRGSHSLRWDGTSLLTEVPLCLALRSVRSGRDRYVQLDRECVVFVPGADREDDRDPGR